MILIQNFYSDNHPQRDVELKYCLYKNINNQFIRKVVLVINEDMESIFFNFSKVEVVKTDKQRPTYSDLFEIANQYDGIKIIANSDIYFNNTLEQVYKIKDNEVYALSRYDLKDDKLHFHNHKDSQDCWMFKDKISIEVDYGLGQPGCDNAIAYEFHNSGYKILNPSLSIQSVHVHTSNIKQYCDNLGRLNEGVQRVPPPYLRLNPVSL